MTEPTTALPEPYAFKPKDEVRIRDGSTGTVLSQHSPYTVEVQLVTGPRLCSTLGMTKTGPAAS